MPDEYYLPPVTLDELNMIGTALRLAAAPAASGRVRDSIEKPLADLYALGNDTKNQHYKVISQKIHNAVHAIRLALTAPPLPADITHIKIEHPHRPYETDNEYADMLRRVRDFGDDRMVPGILQMYALGNPIQGSFAGSLWAIAEWVNERLPFLSAPLPTDGVRDREAIARIVDPKAFQQNADARHRHCSPFTVDVVQNLALAKADAILAALAAPHEQGEG